MSLLTRARFAMQAFSWVSSVEKAGPLQQANQSNGWLTQWLEQRDIPRRGSKELIRAYKRMPRMRMILSKIAGSVSTIPWELYAVRGSGGKGYVRRRDFQLGTRQDRTRISKDLQDRDDLERIDSHPLLDLLTFYNPLLDGCACEHVAQVHYDLKGEEFYQIVRSPVGMPIELWPIPPTWVNKIGNQEKPYELRVGSMAVEIPGDEILYLRDPDPENPYGRGTGVGESMADELDTDEFAAQYIRNFFGNAAVPPFLLSFLKGGEDTVKTFRLLWDQHHRGVSKAHRPEFATGDFKVHEFEQNFQQMQMIPLREFERDLMIETFGVPPEMVGVIENSNRATINTARIIYAEEVVIPRKEARRRFFQECLVPLFDDRLVIDYPSPAPDDEERTLETMKAAPHNFTRNDFRRHAGQPEDPDGDVYMVPANLFEVAAGSEKAALSKPPQKSITKALTETDISAISSEADGERMSMELDPDMARLVAHWGQRALDDIGIEDLEFNPHHSRVVNFLRERSAGEIAGITETTRGAIREALAEGVDEGEGNDKLRRRIRDVFTDASTRRSRNIAKTEVNTASNWSITEGYRQSGVVTERQWVAARRNTRPSHLALDGQRRGINAPFQIPAGENNAGATTDQPGGFGIGAEDINCECTTIAIIKDPVTEEPQLEAIWKTFQSEKAEWDRTIERAANRGFTAQEQDVLAAFDRIAGEGV